MDNLEGKELVDHWTKEIRQYEKDAKDWVDRGKKVVKRYMDERSDMGREAQTGSRFNILWSNVETIMPAIYSRVPEPEVTRRHKDRSQVGRVASMILERCLDYETSYYTDYDTGIKRSVFDRLLPGRGVSWVRYEPTFGVSLQITEDDVEIDNERYFEQDGQKYEAQEYIEHECTHVDYVHWEDFGHCSARTWEEVPAVWRRVYLTKQQFKERFPDFEGEIPMDARDDGQPVSKEKPGKKSCVYELWDKTHKRVIWFNKSLEKPLDVRDDPLGLESFFPCPRPLYATLSSDDLIPVPDYYMYQDQAKELDNITARISKLVEAVKVIGVYDASQTKLQRLLKENDNKLVPVDSWAMFAEKGGIKGCVDFFPIADVVNALITLYEAREQVKQTIYEITGLSDIVRGASDARETATAQQIKSQFGSLRIRNLQMSIAQFAKELLCIKAEIMANLYSDDTLVQMAGVQNMTEVDQQMVPQALQLIRNDLARGFLIEINVDSMVELDQQQEQESRVQFLKAASAFLEKGVVAGQQFPQLGPLLGEMLLFGISGFKVGRQIEGVFDETMERMKQAQATPDQQKQEAEMQAKQMEMRMKMAEQQMQLQKQQMEMQQAQLEAQLDTQSKQMEAMLERLGMKVEAEKLQNKNRYEQAKHAREMEKLEETRQ